MHDHTRSEIIGAYEALIGRLHEKSGELHGACPSCGGDRGKPSDRFWITREGVIGCRQCNDFPAIMRALELSGERDTTSTYAPSTQTEPAPAPEVYGCTLGQYSEKTGLPEEWLKSGSVQLRESKAFIRDLGEVGCVVVPFFDEDEEITCTKHRVQVTGKDKYRYAQGSKACLYGENWIDLARASRKICLVEGETDTQTLWFSEIPAAGVPGANSLKVLKREHFGGIDRVFVVAEQDEVGQKWPAQVQDRLRALGVPAVVLVVNLDAKDTNASFKLDPKTFRSRFITACNAARGLRPSRIKAGSFQTVRQIMRTNYPPVRWIVKGILPEGLAIIVAGPKIGKSFMAWDLALSVSRGSRVFGDWEVDQGEVLYCDLEQPIGAKMQRRIRLLRGENDQNTATVIDEWPKIGHGCCEELDIWLEEHPASRLVVIDTFGQVKGEVSGNVYDAEREKMRRLLWVAERRHVAIVLVHHDKKMPGTADPTDASSGTKAITGGASVVWWLQREFGSREGKLFITGRDVEECELKGRISMCRWFIDKPADPVQDTGQWR